MTSRETLECIFKTAECHSKTACYQDPIVSDNNWDASHQYATKYE